MRIFQSVIKNTADSFEIFIWAQHFAFDFNPQCAVLTILKCAA